MFLFCFYFYFQLSILGLLAVGYAQEYQDFQNVGRSNPLKYSSSSSVDTKPTPVAILKQINRHNEDGSYTYGYEGADGSFKIETKLATGEVKGKYGYTDETGKVRIVEYGANKYGFQPSGEGITVAPPTFVDETTDKNGRTIVDYEDDIPAPRAPAPKYRPQPKLPRPAPQQQQQPQYYEYEQVQQPQEQPRYTAPSVRAQQAPAPQAPPRLQIPGAIPAGGNDVVYSPKPRPARIEPDYDDVGPQRFPDAAPQQNTNAIPAQYYKQSPQVSYKLNKPY